MTYRECIFLGSIPQAEVVGTTFELCIFEVNDLNNLPPAWRCLDCIVVHGDTLHRFGRSIS